MALQITSLYSVALAVILLVLWVNVVKRRAALAVSIGTGGDDGLHEKIRRHGNFVEWVPFVLLMMALAEIRGMADLWLHIGRILMVAGRVLHPFGLTRDNARHPLRILGNTGALLALVIFVVGIAGTLL